MYLLVIDAIIHKISASQAHILKFDYENRTGDNRVLSFREVSLLSLDWMTANAFSMGTDVKSAVTSYERSSSSISTRSFLIRFNESLRVCYMMDRVAYQGG